MKKQLLGLILFASTWSSTRAVRQKSSLFLAKKESSKNAVALASNAAAGEVLNKMFSGKGPQMRHIIQKHSRMNLNEAVDRLDGELPGEVASLVHIASNSTASKTSFDEDSLQKARKILNRMMYTAWDELDALMIECKEFELRNRGTFEQVKNTLARLGSQLAALAEQRSGAEEGIEAQKKARGEVLNTKSTTQMQYRMTRKVNSDKMRIAKNDLAVFDFILTLTQCKESFVQLNAGRPQVCSSQNGELSLHFNDPALQAKVERLMTPDGRVALQEALGQMVDNEQSFIELGAHRATTTTTTTKETLPSFDAVVVPVSEDPHPAGQWKKCIDGEPNCGLLHDLMSLEWGKFRDSFDEMTKTMNENQEAYELEMANLNEQLTAIQDEDTKYKEVLADAIAKSNADTSEMEEKDEQKRELTDEFDTTCAKYRAQIQEVLFTKICAVRRVRNELMTYSSKTPPEKISDCDISDWESADGVCIKGTAEILCDDTCPQDDPYKCGGWEALKRDIVVLPDENGMRCPKLKEKRKCGQKKCPIDCVMSKWSGWSKCTKDCESGVTMRTRSVMTKPMHGGTWCGAVQEERSCNTGSCDRNCKLSAWSAWSPCSMACGGGFQTRIKSVVIPTRGQGRCPRTHSFRRWNKQKCNTQACIGDEICIAKQDLIMAIDASGSLKEPGFDIVKNLALNMTAKYEGKYFGSPAMKVGVVVFGNGKLLPQPDGSMSISAALQIQPLTDKIADVTTKIKALTWQKGFTNMAQALQLADVMLGSRNARAEAQSAVMVLSDGKYSFAFQTAEKARELKDKNVQIFMAPITENKDKYLENLKDWASKPWATNYERIPGLKALKYNGALFAEKLIVKFCPDAMSPSLEVKTMQVTQMLLIKEGGWPSDDCGEWHYEGYVESKAACKDKAVKRKLLAFAYGSSEWTEGECYSEAINVDDAQWKTWLADPKAPACPNGAWIDNEYFDTWAVNPLVTTVS